MTFRQFVFRNVTRNKRLYLAYFLSSSFTVMIFFTFAMFSSHPAVLDAHLTPTADFAFSVSKWLIYVFSFFFVVYSMNVFLQSRKREFGQLMILGMSSGQLRRMVFQENLLIGFAAIWGGIGLGFVFAKAILLIGENIVELGTRLPFYWPLRAIGVTFSAFAVLFLCISFFISTIVRSGKITELLRGHSVSSKEPSASGLLSLLGAILLLISYCWAMQVKREDIITALVPIVILVTLGTYLLLSQLSVFLVLRLKRKEALFWRKTNLILFSDLAYRLKDNTRTFFLVAMISTVSFCAIGSLYGIQNMAGTTLSADNPYSFDYFSYAENTSEREQVQLVQDTLEQAGIRAAEAVTTLNYYSIPGRSAATLMVKASEYNRFAGLSQQPLLRLAKGEAALIQPRKLDFSEGNPLLGAEVPLGTGTSKVSGTLDASVKVGQQLTSPAIRSYSSYLVLADVDYARLQQPVKAAHYYVWQAAQPYPQMLKIGEQLERHFKAHDSYKFYGRDYELLYSRQSLGSILFVGLFVGIVFFVSVGSFLYFRQFSDLDEDKKKFRTISKMGLTDKELHRILTQQISLLFFTPILIAFIHGTVALAALSHMFSYSLFQESAIVLGTFLAIQLLYFFVVRFFYIKGVKAAL